MSQYTLRQFIIKTQCLFPGYENVSAEEEKSNKGICTYKLNKKRTLSNFINKADAKNTEIIRKAFLNKIKFFLYPEKRSVNTNAYDFISDDEFILRCIQFLCNETYSNIRVSSFLSKWIMDKPKERLVELFNQLVNIVSDDTLGYYSLRQFIIETECLFPGYEMVLAEEVCSKNGEEVFKYKLNEGKAFATFIHNITPQDISVIREAFLNKIRFFLYPEKRIIENTADTSISDDDFIGRCTQFLRRKAESP